MNNIWIVMSKEFTRFFTDKRMVITTIMPAILIYVIYSFMGTAMSSVYAPDEDHKSRVYTLNMPQNEIVSMIETFGVVVRVSDGDIAELKEKISNKDESIDTLVIFPPEFDVAVEEYDVQSASSAAPNIEIYYNSTSPNSYQAYRNIYSVLDVFEASLSNKFDVNRDTEDADLATAEDQSATFISTMMPMLLMIFLYSGCMGLALESITGEKERGTLATLLVSPLKRSQLAIGKILSLAVLSFTSGLTTTIATIIALPNLMGDAEMTANIYNTTDYLLLAFVILSTLLLMVAMLSIVSAFAKTVKEAGQAATPVMILVMVVAVTGMFGSATTETVRYLIPLYGSVQSMTGIFSLEYETINVITACISTLAYACIGGFVLTKMFNSEKVMFSR